MQSSRSGGSDGTHGQSLKEEEMRERARGRTRRRSSVRVWERGSGWQMFATRVAGQRLRPPFLSFVQTSSLLALSHARRQLASLETVAAVFNQDIFSLHFLPLLSFLYLRFHSVIISRDPVTKALSALLSRCGSAVHADQTANEKLAVISR